MPTNHLQLAQISTGKPLQTNNSLVSENETAKVDFVNGLVKVTLKLPARGEQCEFNLKLLNDSVGTLIENLKLEDRSIEKAQVFTRGKRNTTLMTWFYSFQINLFRFSRWSSNFPEYTDKRYCFRPIYYKNQRHNLQPRSTQYICQRFRSRPRVNVQK